MEKYLKHDAVEKEELKMLLQYKDLQNKMKE